MSGAWVLLVAACGSSGAGGENPKLFDAGHGQDASADASDLDGGHPPSQTVDAGSDGSTPSQPDSGAMHQASYPPTGDNDGDGLTNELELSLHSDPDYVDTDGDALSDASELGSDSKQPADADADGFPDLLESAVLDNDRDGTPDQTDPADAKAWQLVFARQTPAVIANDGKTRPPWKYGWWA